MRHKNLYHIEEPIIDISVPKLLVIIITVMVFFVIPAQVISLYKSNPEAINEPIQEITASLRNEKENNQVEVSSEGRVAGASTSIDIIATENPSTPILKNQSFLIGGLGIFFLLLSVGGIGYLLELNKQYKKKSKYYYN